MKMTLLSLLSVLMLAPAIGAVEIHDIAFGFGNSYKVGTWVPLTVTVRNRSERTTFKGELVVELRNFSSDVPLERYAAPLYLIGSAPQQKQFAVYCPKNATQLTVRPVPFGTSETAAFQEQDMPLPTPFARKDYFMLVLAPSGDGLKQTLDKQRLAGADQPQVHVRYLPNVAAMPRNWIGYSAVDLLVVREVRLTARRLRPQQQTALLDWVQRGGTLILSGGRNFDYLKNSFIEPYLPVELKGVETTETLPAFFQEYQQENGAVEDRTPTVSRQDSTTQNRNAASAALFERILFAPRPTCETVIGTPDAIYVARRNFGDGQILCLAFDYNVAPFSRHQAARLFWHRLLNTHGKSARYHAERYALALQHEQKTFEHFLSETPNQVPPIKRLAALLPIYLIGVGGLLYAVGRSKGKGAIYWIGGCLFVLISVGALHLMRNLLPNEIAAERVSILSVYPERQRAHRVSYVALRAAAADDMSMDFTDPTFVRHQVGGAPPQKIGTSVQGAHPQLRNISVAPWRPAMYVAEKFFTLDTESAAQPRRTLENTWRVTGKEMVYIGDAALIPETTPEIEKTLRQPLTPKIPPDTGLVGTRQTFAQLLRQDQVFRYLVPAATRNTEPYLIGWVSDRFNDSETARWGDTDRQTFVIFRPDTGQRINSGLLRRDDPKER